MSKWTDIPVVTVVFVGDGGQSGDCVRERDRVGSNLHPMTDITGF